MKNWLQFANERFNLATHLPMIGVFAGAHALFLIKLGATPIGTVWQFWGLLGAFYSLFFFLLRCYDEIKDYAYDLIHNPLRPLPRGLLSVRDLKTAILIIVLLLSAFMYIFDALPIGFLVLLYSFLMYKEFFIGKYIRGHLTFYAVTHTFVIGFCSFIVSWAFIRPDDSQAWKAIIVYSLANWLLFNVFEFARKTFARSEEKSDVDSYSKTFGNIGAVSLSLSQFILASVALCILKFESIAHWILLLSALFVGILFVVKNNPQFATLYRHTISVILMLYYVLICLEFK